MIEKTPPPSDIAASIAALPPLRDAIRMGGLDARKSLGQNFLLDMNLTMRIARAAMPFGETVLEIGPGPGGLTRALLACGAQKLVAVEKDDRAIAALAPLAEIAGGRLEIIRRDALDLDIAEIGGDRGGRKRDSVSASRNNITIAANLPYNIATPLLLKWLDTIGDGRIASMTLLFQKEVAMRITAAPDTKAYGRLGVICGWLCEAQMLFDIPPDAFTPKPKVTSTLVRLIPRKTPLAVAQKPALEETTRILFGQRRKMLRASLKAATPDPAALLERAGIDGTRRPENLTIGEFCTLARLLMPSRADA